MKYSYYESRFSKTCRQVSVAELLEHIGTKDLKEKCAKIAAHVLAGEDKEAQQLKSELPCIVVSELYKEGAPRKKGTGEPTGLFVMDWDYCRSMEELNELQNKVKQVAISHPVLKDLIVAAHTSPRLHGVHVLCRWIDGCHSIEECQAKFAELADLPNYDTNLTDSSRCSLLVHKDMFFVTNWGAMERNEAYAELQRTLTQERKKDGKRIKSNDTGRGVNAASVGGSDNNDCGADPDGQPERQPVKNLKSQTSNLKPTTDPKLVRIFKELTVACAPKGFIDEEGNVSEGARDNTLLHVLNLFRYVAGVKPDVLRAYLPDWAKALDDDNPGTTDSMIERCCERQMSPNLPPTLRTVLKRIEESKGEDGMTKEELNEKYNEELAKIEENQRFFFEVPKELPPVFAEYVKAFPFAWKPAAILSLLPVLGTLMSKVRSVYLDTNVHSLSFQTVIEADYASGKSNITNMARFCLTPLTDADMIGNEKLNAYNALVERVNKTEKLPEKPDVCVRKIAGDFTVAGFEETLNTSKGLHMWCSTAEIDEVRKVWAAVSHILRKSYDNENYGRSLQSTKTFKGERKLFFNTLLCGTPKRVDAVYYDPEDGLVSRTLFFRLLWDDGTMPVVRMNDKTKKQLTAFLQKLHDKFSLGTDGNPVDEQMYVVKYVNSTMEKWLKEKYDESVRTGNFAMDAFRRRDAVNGFRAGVLAHVLMLEKYGRALTEKQKKLVQTFALWVAEYSLRSHLAKFGTELKRGDTSRYGADARKKDILAKLPDVFTIADAYETLNTINRNTVRTTLVRLVSAGYLKKEDKGFYIKTKKV